MEDKIKHILQDIALGAVGVAITGLGLYQNSTTRIPPIQAATIKYGNAPTVQQANRFLQKKFGNKLSKTPDAKIKQALAKRYGKQNAQNLMDGYAISESLLPEQQRQQKVQIANTDTHLKDYVGLSKLQINTNVKDPNDARVKGEKVDIGGQGAVPINRTLTFTKIGKEYSLSNPVAFNYSMKQLIKQPSAKNDNEYTLLFFVQAPNYSSNRNELVHFVKKLNVTVNGKQAHLAVGKGEKNGLQLSNLPQSANGLSLDKNRNIYPNSIVPVAFEVKLPKGETISGTPIEVNGNEQPQLLSTNQVQISL